MILSRLIHITDWLGKVSAGSTKADWTIHETLDRTGPSRPDMTDRDAAVELLPLGFEWREPVHSAEHVYASCRRSGMEAG
jgi:hypothetical protein